MKEEEDAETARFSGHVYTPHVHVEATQMKQLEQFVPSSARLFEGRE